MFGDETKPVIPDFLFVVQLVVHIKIRFFKFFCCGDSLSFDAGLPVSKSSLVTVHPRLPLPQTKSTTNDGEKSGSETLPQTGNAENTALSNII